MNPEDVSRAEIFQVIRDTQESVAHGVRLIKWLFALVIFQIVIKLYETFRVMKIGRRVERQLDMSAVHGAVTDSQKDRMAALLDRAIKVLIDIESGAVQVKEEAKTATETVIQAVKEVPDKVVERIAHTESGNGGSRHDLPAQGGSGINLG